MDGLLAVTKASTDALLQPQVYEQKGQTRLKTTLDDLVTTDYHHYPDRIETGEGFSFDAVVCRVVGHATATRSSWQRRAANEHWNAAGRRLRPTSCGCGRERAQALEHERRALHAADRVKGCDASHGALPAARTDAARAFELRCAWERSVAAGSATASNLRGEWTSVPRAGIPGRTVAAHRGRLVLGASRGNHPQGSPGPPAGPTADAGPMEIGGGGVELDFAAARRAQGCPMCSDTDLSTDSPCEHGPGLAAGT